MAQFHLSLGVDDLARTVRFYREVLRAVVTHADEGGYVNLDFYGAQITLKERKGLVPALAELHFGANLSLAAFEALAAHVQAAAPASVVAAPHAVDAGTPRERRKMYVRCPAGYLIELKGRA